MGWIIRLFLCLFFAGLTLYKYIDKLNSLTELKLAIPALAKEVREIEEKNLELAYEIEQFESPVHLIELVNKPEFGHLKYPSLNEVIIVTEPSVSQGSNETRP
jgi:predicted ATP-grasp superfamily ATP-dependent carboligase